MSRNFNNTVLTALRSDRFSLVLLVELDFSSGTVYTNSSPIDLQWANKTWTGLMGVGDLDAIKENTENKAANIKMTLTGIPRDLVGVSINENYQGRAVNIYLGALDENIRLYDSPVLVWAGKMDTMSVALGETAAIQLKCESNLVDWSRPKIRRYTDQEQQARFPGDLGLQFVNKMADLELTWGES